MFASLLVAVLAVYWSVLPVPAGAVPLPARAQGHLAPYSRATGTVGEDLSCELCKVASGVLELFLERESSEEDIEKLAAEICFLKHIEDKYICDTIIPVFKNEVLTVAYYITLGQAKLACAVLLGPSCVEGYDPTNQTWNIAIPGGKPPVKPIPNPKAGAPTTRILHLSDIHWDQNYTDGLSNNCGEPICCRYPNKPGSGPTAAGHWGDYNCDLSYFTLISLMEHLNTIQDQFDLVYMTGDLPAHNDWSQSRQSQLFVLNTISNLMRQYLPDKKIYFTFGNHEGFPVNSFPPPDLGASNGGPEDPSWLLDDAANAWSRWLSPDAIATLKYGGFYNQKVYDGLRVISLQTNYANNENYWLFINDTDPAGQLKWLTQQLLDAEKAGDKVHIIGHIPPSAFTYAFKMNYYKIVNRFESTIAGQFFGHTHQDEFVLFVDEVNKTRTTSIAFVAPSITTDHDNAGFRIYTVDGQYSGSSHAVLDFDATYMNISDANLKNKPTWLPEYNAKDAYAMATLHPADWADLVNRFRQNDALFQQYYKYRYKLRPPSATCDSGCKASILCAMLPCDNS